MLPGPTIAAVRLVIVLLLELRRSSGSKPLMDASTRSPGANGTNGPRAPDRTRWPARSGSPKRRAWTASQRSASSGSPRQAAPLPDDRSSPLMVSDIVDVARLELVERPALAADDEEPARRVVGDGVGEPDVPVLDPRVDDLERRQRHVDALADGVDGDVVLVAGRRRRPARTRPPPRPAAAAACRIEIGCVRR